MQVSGEQAASASWSSSQNLRNSFKKLMTNQTTRTKKRAVLTATTIEGQGEEEKIFSAARVGRFGQCRRSRRRS